MNNQSKEQAAEKCHNYFNSGYSCCEAMLLAFSEQLGIDSELIPRIATPFGGGIHQRRYMCGALTGALMAIGLKHGRDSSQCDRKPTSARAGKIIEKFFKVHGSVNCIEVLGYTPDDLEKVTQIKDQLRAKICNPLIKQTAEWLWEELK